MSQEEMRDILPLTGVGYDTQVRPRTGWAISKQLSNKIRELKVFSIITPLESPRFRFPWGTTPGAYYNWDSTSSPTAGSGVVVYMVGSGSKWTCCDSSHRLGSDGELVANGTFRIPEEVLQNYARREVEMEEGGM
ncbi:MAG: hypothetical protein M1812_004381 [Candelaria pacifica]|nr:MAG: hypothetical protein M1812_004381 [Candelaria pacifica]